MVKRKPHHSLDALKQKFALVETLEVTTTAVRSAIALGYDLDGMVEMVQSLTSTDFDKSETAHSPRNSRVWHDTYRLQRLEHRLYLKFAGETLIDVTLVSFKEA